MGDGYHRRVIRCNSGAAEVRRNREEREAERHQKEVELRWNKAKLAREILQEVKSNSKVAAAMQMLDWSGRSYEISPGKVDSVTFDDLKKAMRVSDLNFSPKEAFIRDCFDQFFDALEVLEHYLRTNLIQFDDVTYPLEYYANKVQHLEDSFVPFLETYRYNLAESFIKRFTVRSLPGN